MIRYESTSHIVTAGLTLRPGDRLHLGLQLNWAASTAGMAPFSLTSPEFTARVPLLVEDFSQTPSYSDLDVAQIDGSVSARYAVNDRVWIRGAYRYVDYDDTEIYLYDTSGRNHLVSLALGWNF